MKITMKYPEEYQRFKYLLEYFVAHLEYIASDYSSSSLGYEKYIKPLVEAESFKSSGQGYNDQAIQSQVSKWDYYTNGQICINVYGANCQSRGTYLNWKGTGNNIMADWKGTHIESLYLLYYDPDSRERFSKDVSFTIKELGLFDNQTPNSNLCNLFDEYNLMIEKTNKKQRVWLWSIKVSEPWQDTLNIGSSAKTITDFRQYKSRSELRKA